MMTREEHLAWAKDRAGEYLDAGDLQNAFSSMVSDLNKHDALRDHAGIMLGMMQNVAGLLKTDQAMRKWIEGFR